MSFLKHIKKEGRMLPVFLVVDTSGSMRSVIGTVTESIKEMIRILKKIENPKGEISICIIGFGGDEAKVLYELTKVNEFDENKIAFNAAGQTPMGMAFEKLVHIIEDEDVIPLNAYAPTIVLFSDGSPTDLPTKSSVREKFNINEWVPLNMLLNSSRCKYATRLAIGIEDSINREVLKAFIGNDNIPLINAHSLESVKLFVKFVTQSLKVISQKPEVMVGSITETNPFDKENSGIRELVDLSKGTFNDEGDVII